MADPDRDQAPLGCVLYGITPDIWIDIGWSWADWIPVPHVVLTDSIDSGTE